MLDTLFRSQYFNQYSKLWNELTYDQILLWFSIFQHDNLIILKLNKHNRWSHIHRIAHIKQQETPSEVYPITVCSSQTLSSGLLKLRFELTGREFTLLIFVSPAVRDDPLSRPCVRRLLSCDRCDCDLTFFRLTRGSGKWLLVDLSSDSGSLSLSLDDLHHIHLIEMFLILRLHIILLSSSICGL